MLRGGNWENILVANGGWHPMEVNLLIMTRSLSSVQSKRIVGVLLCSFFVVVWRDVANYCVTISGFLYRF